jgi:hypothetical protein
VSQATPRRESSGHSASDPGRLGGTPEASSWAILCRCPQHPSTFGGPITRT